MPLDMDALYLRVSKMIIDLPVAPPSQLQEARAFLRQADPQVLRAKLRQRERGAARIPWLVAQPVGTLAETYPVPPLPRDLSVVAADGSTVPPDRHSPVRFFVLNLGYAALMYGETPGAILDSEVQFCFEEEELYFDPEGRRIPIEGTRLGIKMAIEEIVKLGQAVHLVSSSAVALSDGSLILWNLQSEDQDLQNEYVARLLDALDGFRQDGIPIASYISFPGSHDVVNSLRLMLCDAPSGGCTRCPQETGQQRLCRFMGSIWDRQLFEGLLQPGARSDIFESQSAILRNYEQHHIQFFYLNVGGEIARIEAPQWVMADHEMLDLVHGAVIDQCRRSGQYPPYPPALIEAHEQAVISTAEREVVEEIVEQALARKGIFYLRSAKDRSKRSRGV